MNRNGSKWIRPEKRLAIYDRDHFCCQYCGAGAEDGVQLTLDHVTPRELGGENKAGNLVTCCLSCNSAKRDTPLRIWLASLRDRGVDTSRIARRVRRAVARKINKARGRELLAARKEED